MANPLQVDERARQPAALPRVPAPSDVCRRDDVALTEDLGALGYPGFAYLGSSPRNPAEVLLDALDRPDLDVRVVEGLPWLPMMYPDMDWEWLVSRAKKRGVQNRVGFVVALGQRMAQRRGMAEVVDALAPVLEELGRARLCERGTLCQDSWPAVLRTLAHQRRSAMAEYWNLDTRLTEEHLAHYEPV